MDGLSQKYLQTGLIIKTVFCCDELRSPSQEVRQLPHINCPQMVYVVSLVRIPSTSFTLFQFIDYGMFVYVMRKGRNKQTEAGLGLYIKMF